MGYMCHHTIIVTTYRQTYILSAHNAAKELFGVLVSGIVESVMNGYYSFFIAPDGSKEGWDESDEYDKKRGQFIEWLDGFQFEDGSSPFKWFEAQYGDDDDDNWLTRHDAQKVQLE